jgi:adenylate cyclase
VADIFVSYASDDRDRILPLVEMLEAEGWSVWWDRELAAGPSFEEKIQEALDQAGCVVVAWSNSAIKSGWCRDEAQEGIERKVLVPVRIDDIRPPLGFRSSQTASLIGWPDVRGDLSSLFAGIHECLGTLTSSPVISPARAIETAIAVLPFRNMSNDPDQEFFSDGIAEDILNELAKSSKDLIVRPPLSSFALKGESLPVAAIGERLGVTHVLQGSVRRAGDRIRVTAQLSDVASDRSIWSDRYDREMTDIFKVQDEVTGEILAALNVQLTRRRGSREFVGTEAYDAFLRGLYHNRRAEFELASQWYEKAAVLDPTNADLWGERARQLAQQMSFGRIPNSGSYRERKMRYVERALSIDPSHWARVHKAEHLFIEDRQYQRAIDELAEIVITNPNSWQAVMELTFAIGGVDRQSEAYYRAARHCSRLYMIEGGVEIQMLVDSGRIDEAHSALYAASQKGMTTGPQRQLTARLAAIEGDIDGLEALIANRPDNAQPSSFREKYFAALAAYLRRDFNSAREIISSVKSGTRYQPFLFKHEIALFERDLDAAVDYYAKAVDAAEPAAMFWHRDTCFLNRVFPEFVAYPPYQQILKDIKLDPESTAKIRIPDLPF